MLFVSLGCLTLFFVLFVKPQQYNFQGSSCDVDARGKKVDHDVLARVSVCLGANPVSAYDDSPKVNSRSIVRLCLELGGKSWKSNLGRRLKQILAFIS